MAEPAAVFSAKPTKLLEVPVAVLPILTLKLVPSLKKRTPSSEDPVVLPCSLTALTCCRVESLEFCSWLLMVASASSSERALVLFRLMVRVCWAPAESAAVTVTDWLSVPLVSRRSRKRPLRPPLRWFGRYRRRPRWPWT